MKYVSRQLITNTNRLSEIALRHSSENASRHSRVILGFCCYALLNDSTIRGYSNNASMLRDPRHKQQIPNKEIRKLVTLGILSATEV